MIDPNILQLDAELQNLANLLQQPDTTSKEAKDAIDTSLARCQVLLGNVTSQPALREPGKLRKIGA